MSKSKYYNKTKKNIEDKITRCKLAGITYGQIYEMLELMYKIKKE